MFEAKNECYLTRQKFKQDNQQYFVMNAVTRFIKGWNCISKTTKQRSVSAKL